MRDQDDAVYFQLASMTTRAEALRDAIVKRDVSSGLTLIENHFRLYAILDTIYVTAYEVMEERGLLNDDVEHHLNVMKVTLDSYLKSIFKWCQD